MPTELLQFGQPHLRPSSYAWFEVLGNHQQCLAAIINIVGYLSSKSTCTACTCPQPRWASAVINSRNVRSRHPASGVLAGKLTRGLWSGTRSCHKCRLLNKSVRGEEEGVCISAKPWQWTLAICHNTEWDLPIRWNTRGTYTSSCPTNGSPGLFLF